MKQNLVSCDRCGKAEVDMKVLTPTLSLVIDLYNKPTFSVDLCLECQQSIGLPDWCGRYQDRFKSPPPAEPTVEESFIDLLRELIRTEAQDQIEDHLNGV